MDARFLNDPKLRVKIPNIRRLVKDGASATVVGVAPSDSWPAHASLVTGLSPWQNGIVANGLPAQPDQRFFDASSFRAETLWDAATKAGMKVATVYWPTT